MKYLFSTALLIAMIFILGCADQGPKKGSVRRAKPETRPAKQPATSQAEWDDATVEEAIQRGVEYLRSHQASTRPAIPATRPGVNAEDWGHEPRERSSKKGLEYLQRVEQQESTEKNKPGGV